MPANCCFIDWDLIRNLVPLGWVPLSLSAFWSVLQSHSWLLHGTFTCSMTFLVDCHSHASSHWRWVTTVCIECMPFHVLDVVLAPGELKAEETRLTRCSQLCLDASLAGPWLICCCTFINQPCFSCRRSGLVIGKDCSALASTRWRGKHLAIRNAPVPLNTAKASKLLTLLKSIPARCRACVSQNPFIPVSSCDELPTLLGIENRTFRWQLMA